MVAAGGPGAYRVNVRYGRRKQRGTAQGRIGQPSRRQQPRHLKLGQAVAWIAVPDLLYFTLVGTFHSNWNGSRD